jgi:threonine dehydratase
VLRTPLRRSEWLSAASNADISIKLEGIQNTFSYKVRGALNAVLQLADRPVRPPALVTASAGNHGRGLAFAAAMARLPLIVYVPEEAPRVKLDAMRAAGAELVACRGYDEAEARAKEHGAQGTALYVSPYSHPDIIAGAGTVALEILEQDPAVEVIVCPVGGGGLISGTAIAAYVLALPRGDADRRGRAVEGLRRDGRRERDRARDCERGLGGGEQVRVRVDAHQLGRLAQRVEERRDLRASQRL